MSQGILRRVEHFAKGVVGLAAIFLFVTLFASSGVAQASPSVQTVGPGAQGEHPVAIYFFWGDGYPYCAAAKPFLAELTERYPHIRHAAPALHAHLPAGRSRHLSGCGLYPTGQPAGKKSRGAF